MTRLLLLLLTLLFSLGSPARGKYCDFGCWSNAANGTGQLVQTEFAFARGASIQTHGVTQAGETFVRVGASEASTGVRAGSYAMPEATFNALGRDPAVLKNALDLPGSAPQYFRYIRPPAGTPIQRGIVPGGEFGGVGGHPEVIFPKGIN
jgi:hypothetical protein